MSPIHTLPPDYQEAEHLILMQPGKYLLLNLLALVPLVIGLVVMGAWWTLVVRLRGTMPGGFGADWPWWVWILLLLLVSIVIHEGLHGLAILWAGHKPRFGMMLSKGAFYATADDALFPRNSFIVSPSRRLWESRCCVWGLFTSCRMHWGFMWRWRQY